MTGPADQTVDPESEAPLSMRWTIGRVAAVTTIVAIVVFWAWILSGAPAKPNPDFITDRTLAKQVQERCKEFRTQIDGLPGPQETPEPGARAEVIDQVTNLAASMIDDIEAMAPSSGGQAKSMAGWIKDWRTYLQDRRDFTTQLREDDQARLLLDVSPLGDSVDKTIEIYTQVNRIPECATPGDIG